MPQIRLHFSDTHSSVIKQGRLKSGYDCTWDVMFTDNSTS